MMKKVIHSGFPSLDEVLQGIRLGDNVVWQITDLNDYQYFAQRFAQAAIADGYRLVYLRFASHPPILPPQPGLEIIELDPKPGFDAFSGTVNHIIEERGRECFYVFDNISALVAEWTTDELLANFFQVTCPFLFELDTVAYFGLTLGSHNDRALARIRDTTQLLLNVYRIKNERYLHPLKVWDRYSSQMFIPHRIQDNEIIPLHHSGDVAEVFTKVQTSPLRTESDAIAPWESVYRQLRQYDEEGEGEDSGKPEILYLKQELTRMILGAHPEFSRLADEYFRLEDLFAIRSRIIGSGQIGGKAAGMLLARRILLKNDVNGRFAQVLENHDSFYIGSDVFFSFLVHNNLFRLRLHLTRGSDISDEEFNEVEQRFLGGHFPREIMEQFQNMLEYFGQAPIIVRSSSLLEDSFGNAFAGKYRSEFCTNQGSPEDRLEAFLQAVKLVYASALNPDALSYRRNRGLHQREEQMALLVQRVSGMPYRNYFFPTLAGVAFSRNLYAWSDRIDQKQGVIRLVFGLGTRAVDRVGGDYPRLISVSHPELRPEVGNRVVKYSQRDLDLLDLEKNDLVSVPVSEVINDGVYPNLHLLVSLLREGYLSDPDSAFVDPEQGMFVLTFNNLIHRTPLVKIVGEMLKTIEQGYGHPVDTEFTAFVTDQGEIRINLLQCRPLGLPGTEDGVVTLPESIPAEDVLFRSSRIVTGGKVADIRYIILIDPAAYSALADREMKKSLGRVVGRINSHPAIREGKSIMMGPGRWGSSNLDLGVNVHYSDISNTAVLVEIAREEAGHAPEVSYGTHFFLDLVEAHIIYLPVYPDDAEVQYNSEFLEQSPNLLPEILPDAQHLQNLIRVIDVERVTPGKRLQVAADPHAQKAVCYVGK